MRHWVLLLVGVVLVTGCDKLEELEPEDDEEEVTPEMEQAVSRMETTFEEVSAYHDSLSRICKSSKGVSAERQQELNKGFKQAVADFRKHHHAFHQAYQAAEDDDKDDDRYENKSGGPEGTKESYHDDEEEEAYEGDEDDDEDENEREDKLEEREASLYDQVEVMEANRCTPASN
jgi:hypothetical protein